MNAPVRQGALATLALDVGLVLLCGFITLMFWEGHRLAAVGVMALLFLAMIGMLMREGEWIASSKP